MRDLFARMRWPSKPRGTGEESRPGAVEAGPGGLHPGDVVDGRYVVKDRLGQGGTSEVYLAEQTSMGREVALKVLRPELVRDEGARRRFLRESRAVARLKSPHTISVFDVGSTPDGLLYIAMERLRGKSLFQAMCDAPGALGTLRSVGLVDQVLDSLDEAHRQGVLHRDLKPENLFLLAGHAGDEFVKVLDFGIAELRNDVEGRQTEAGMVLGTPRYMSPEQSEGKELDARTDLYSLAVVLFEMLAGHFPFEAPTPLAVALRKLREDPPAVRDLNPRARVPAALETFLKGALARDPALRPASAAEFRAAMRRAMQGFRADVPEREIELSSEDVEVVVPARAPAASSGHDRRRDGRERRMVSLRFRLAGGECRATSLDLSAGGAFLFSRSLPSVGTRVVFACPDPGEPGAVLRLVGQVVRVVEQPSDAGQVRGFAVKWLLPPGSEPPATVSGLFARVRDLEALRTARRACSAA